MATASYPLSTHRDKDQVCGPSGPEAVAARVAHLGRAVRVNIHHPSGGGVSTQRAGWDPEGKVGGAGRV